MSRHTKAATGSLFFCPRHQGMGVKVANRAMCESCYSKRNVAQGRRYRARTAVRPRGRPKSETNIVAAKGAATGWNPAAANDWLRRPLKGVSA